MDADNILKKETTKTWEDLPIVPIGSVVAALEHAGVSHIEAIKLANKMFVTEKEYNELLKKNWYDEF